MIAKNKRARRTGWQIFKMPVLIGVISIGGLVSALVGDGAFDWLSWLALGIPILLLGWCLLWVPDRER